MDHVEYVWVYNRARPSFPSGIYTYLDQAERWIEQHGLTGTLTADRVDTGVYERAIAVRCFPSPTRTRNSRRTGTSPRDRH